MSVLVVIPARLKATRLPNKPLAMMGDAPMIVQVWRRAMEAAIDAFYVKVLADDRVKHFFDDVSMDKQRRKQKEFLSAAFGGPLPWTGKDMRKAHEGMGLTEAHFNAIAENLVNTLKDLKISQDLIDQVVAVALTTKDDVLGRPKKAN
jgi:hemoglobin